MVLNDIEKRIKEKIERIGIPLKDWKVTINYGVKTGFNDAFIIDGKKKEELILEDPKSAELIRPILRGRDIKRYGYEFADNWLINTHNGVKEKGIKPINIADYPAIKRHLDLYQKELSKRQDKGVTPYNLRNCVYMDDFHKQKIIYPEITKFLNFYLDDKAFYVNNKCFIITGESLYFLCAFFNSSLFKFCFRDNFPELLGGSRELRKIFFEKVPIKQVTDKENLLFKDFIDKLGVIAEDKASQRSIIGEIDNAIFDLYNLSHTERQHIGFIEIE